MKEIPQYKGLYSTTRDGNIFSHRRNIILKPWIIGHGYEMVMLYKDGEKPRKFLTHRLIATNYIPNPKNLPEVNHKDANRRNNRPENLEWVTSKDNKQHAIKLGLYKGHEKLNEQQVREIRSRYKGKGKGIMQSELATEYNTTQFNISWIIRGKGWTHVV